MAPRKAEPEKAVEEEQPDLLQQQVEKEEPEKEEVIKVESAEEPEPQEQEDAAEALRKRLEEVTRSEELYRQRAEASDRAREEAIKTAREREAEASRFRQEAHQSQLAESTSAIAQSKAEADKAQADYESAVSIGDTKAQAEAQRRMLRAEAAVMRWEEIKGQIEERTKEVEAKPVKEEPQQGQLPQLAMDWIRAHPEYLQDQRKNAQLNFLHHEAIAAGHTAYTQPYIDWIEQELGLKRKPEERRQEAAPERQRTPVSAPVNREDAPSLGGTRSETSIVRLTAAQREAAKTAGIPEAEYAKQLKKIIDQKANGTFGGQQ